MIVHIAKLPSPIKYKPNNRLPGDLNRILSSSISNSSITTTCRNNNLTNKYDKIDINSTKYKRINTLYCYSRNITKTRGELVDRGDNGVLTGDNVRVRSKKFRTVNLQGKDKH